MQLRILLFFLFFSPVSLPAQPPPIRNLVFEGGGISAGAITALALKYNVKY